MKQADGRFDAILLLGLELGKDDRPEEELCSRVHAAAAAYRAHAGVRIIACGGVTPGHRLSEAEVMRAGGHKRLPRPARRVDRAKGGAQGEGLPRAACARRGVEAEAEQGAGLHD